jgi:hypothetical protein
MEQPRGRITPLWIIAAFVSLTEATLGYAVTKTTAGVQISLTVFVISFALLVAAGFFVILWHRPFVFYSPSEYGGVDPKGFIDAIKKSVSPRVAEQVELVRSIEKDPQDKDAQYNLINSLLDSTIRQHMILMHEKAVEIPYSDMFGHQYKLGTKNKHMAHGMFQPGDFVRKLEGTKFVELAQHHGIKIRLTDEGKRFASWLTTNGQKDDFMDTPLGGWGEPVTLGPEPKAVAPARAIEGKKTGEQGAAPLPPAPQTGPSEGAR